MIKNAVIGACSALGVVLALVLPVSVLADDGTPTTPTTTDQTATMAPSGAPANPWANPKNYSYALVVKTQYGVVHGRYLPLAESFVKVYNPHGTLIHTARTGKTGMATVKLPKGRSRVTIGHAPWHGYRFLSKSYTMKAPMFRPPGDKSAFMLNFCVAGNCAG